MKTRFFLVLVMALLAIGAILAVEGCDTAEQPVQPAPVPSVDERSAADDATATTKGEQLQTATGYPNYSFGLGVPYVYQVLPGATFAGTKTCGQACAAMLGGHFNRVPISQQTIINENNWLNGLFPGLGYATSNSYYTNFSGRNALGRLLREYHGLQYTVYYGNRADDVVNEILRGRPVIVGVMISGGRLVSSGGVAHWVVAKGWDSRIILNDPGTSSGNSIAYSVAAFEASWATQGKIYIPVWK